MTSIENIDEFIECINDNNESNVVKIYIDSKMTKTNNSYFFQHLNKFRNLESLLIYENPSKTIHPVIFTLIKLKTLALSGNNFGKIPDDLRKLVNLNSIEFNDCKLNFFPEAIYSLVKLKEIEMNNNNIKELSGKITLLTNLELFKISHNKITSLPNNIGSLVKLTHFYINNNKITSLPYSIGSLTNLILFSINQNEITSLPNTIGSLTNLEYLSLSINKIISLPNSIGSLVNVNELNLSYNKITSLPNSLGSLTKLKDLKINQNEITSLPNSITLLTNLEYFYLSNNKITSLPNNIGSLTNLKRLYINNNKITTLPNSIGSLTNLIALSIIHNEITSLPREIINLNLVQFEIDLEILDEESRQIVQQIHIVQPQHQPPVEDVANEIHDEFNKTFSNREESYIALLDSLIKSSSPTKTTFNEIIPIISSFVSSPENLKKLNKVLERFGNSKHSKHSNTVKLIAKTIQFVNEQPQEFKNLYSDIFIQDCFHAYQGNQGDDTLSCIQGMVEKFVLSLHQTLIGICSDTESCKNKDYVKLKDFFNKKVDLNEVAEQWSSLSLTDRKGTDKVETINKFKNFIKNKYNEIELKIDADEQKKIDKYIESIDYVFDDDNLEFGGSCKKKKRKTMKKKGGKRKTKKQKK
jgi:Leucine-rich repeat (LRR) protein